MLITFIFLLLSFILSFQFVLPMHYYHYCCYYYYYYYYYYHYYYYYNYYYTPLKTYYHLLYILYPSFLILLLLLLLLLLPPSHTFTCRTVTFGCTGITTTYLTTTTTTHTHTHTHTPPWGKVAPLNFSGYNGSSLPFLPPSFLPFLSLLILPSYHHSFPSFLFSPFLYLSFLSSLL